MTSQPRSRPTSTTPIPEPNFSEVTPASTITTTEPAAAYIATRISPPPSPLPLYDSYKEQRLYNYVMSTGTTPSAARRQRAQTIVSAPENGSFFSNLFNGNNAQANSPISSTPLKQSHARSQSMNPPPPPTSGPGRKISHFFGLGISSSDSSNSGLAFSSGGSSKVSQSRSVSNSTTLSNFTRPGASGDYQDPMTRDEFSEIDFKGYISTSLSPLNCTPQAFKALQDKSLEMLDRLYSGYLERSRALTEALSEIEALRDDLDQKDQKIEGLKFSVEQLANVQETLSKVAEDAEKAAEKATDELKKVQAEKNRLQWAANSIREVEEDNESLLSVQKFSRVSSGATIVHHRTKSSNSDSGFESDTDSGSVFSHDYSPFASKTAETSPVPTYPPSIAATERTVDEYNYPSKYDEEVPQITYNTGPLQHLRNVLRKTTGVDGRCDCATAIARLKHENGHLHGRVKELEGCLDSCLDLVGGL